jgi:hypothetical protein
MDGWEAPMLQTIALHGAARAGAGRQYAAHSVALVVGLSLTAAWSFAALLCFVPARMNDLVSVRCPLSASQTGIVC